MQEELHLGELHSLVILLIAVVSLAEPIGKNFESGHVIIAGQPEGVFIILEKRRYRRAHSPGKPDLDWSLAGFIYSNGGRGKETAGSNTGLRLGRQNVHQN